MALQAIVKKDLAGTEDGLQVPSKLMDGQGTLQAPFRKEPFMVGHYEQDILNDPPHKIIDWDCRDRRTRFVIDKAAETNTRWFTSGNFHESLRYFGMDIYDHEIFLGRSSRTANGTPPADWNSNKIKVYDLDGTFKRNISLPNVAENMTRWPYHGVQVYNDEVYTIGRATDPPTLYVYNLAGSLQRSWAVGAPSVSLFSSSKVLYVNDGRVLVLISQNFDPGFDRDEVEIYNTSGGLEQTIVHPGFLVRSWGDGVIVDSGNPTIYLSTPNGNVYRYEFSGGAWSVVTGIALDAGVMDWTYRHDWDPQGGGVYWLWIKDSASGNLKVYNNTKSGGDAPDFEIANISGFTFADMAFHHEVM